MKNLKRILCVLMCTVMAVLSTGCMSESLGGKAVMVQFGEEKVTRDEYLVYLYETIRSFESIGGEDIWETDFDGKSAFDVAKENALNSLKIVKLTVLNSERAEVSLTEEEVAEAEKQAQEYVGKYGDSEYEVVLTVMKDKAIYNKTKEKVLSEYSVGEADFNSFVDTNREYYTGVLSKVDYMILSSPDKAEAESMKSAIETEGFEKAVASFESSNLNNEGTLDAFSNIEFDIEKHREGYVSDIIESNGSYAFYYINKVELPTEEAILEMAQNDYNELLLNEIFTDLLEQWEKENVMSVDGVIYNNIIM